MAGGLNITHIEYAIMKIAFLFLSELAFPV